MAGPRARVGAMSVIHDVGHVTDARAAGQPIIGRVTPPAGRSSDQDRQVPSAAFAVLIVVLAAFLFGAATAPLGLLLGLPPAAVVLAVFVGTGAFTLISVWVVLNRVPDGLARQARRGLRHGPRLARWWDRAGGGRVAGRRAAVTVDRGAAILDRVGHRGAALLAPIAGRWLVAAAGVALDPPRHDLYRWAALGCATWAVGFTLGADLLAQLLRSG